ncbi:MAG: Lrp/AsnC ligand binding domain-containing protein [Candidatus Caldarchaeum sp.]
MVKAYVLVSTKPGTSEEVTAYLREARSVQGVVAADSVFGRYDAIITVEVSDLAELSRLIYKVIEKIPNVVRTETCIVLFSEDGR